MRPVKQRLARRRAESGGVEAVVLQPGRCQLLRGRRLAGAAEGAARTEPGIVDEDDQHVGRACRWPQLVDLGVVGIRVLGIVSDEAGAWAIGDGKNRPLDFVGFISHMISPLLFVVNVVPVSSLQAATEKTESVKNFSVLFVYSC